MGLFRRELRIKPVKDVARVIYDLRKCEIFHDVPEENIREMVPHMERVQGIPDAAILRQGEKGDYYYVILSGKAGVFRRTGEERTSKMVAELGPGTGFGEEALIKNAIRNATVKLLEDSVLVRIAKDGFIDYIERSLVQWLSLSEARRVVKEGARWVDVRNASDSSGRIPQALSIPLTDLRDRMGELDKKTLHVCYCGDGRLSACAAFLLRQGGYPAAALKGGLQGAHAELRH